MERVNFQHTVYIYAIYYIIFGCLHGTLTAIRDLFRDYKTLDGKSANKEACELYFLHLNCH